MGIFNLFSGKRKKAKCNRSLTSEELNALFFCPEFVQKYSKLPEHLKDDFLGKLSQNEVERYIKVGIEMNKKMMKNLGK